MKNKKYILIILQIAIFLMFLFYFYTLFIIKSKSSIYLILGLVVFFVLMVLWLIYWIIKLRNFPNEVRDKKIDPNLSYKQKLFHDEKIIFILNNIILYNGDRINKNRRFASYSNVISGRLVVTDKRLIIPRNLFGFDISYNFFYKKENLRNPSPFKHNYLISHLKSSKNTIIIPVQFNHSHTTYKIFTAHYKEILENIMKYGKKTF